MVEVIFTDEGMGWLDGLDAKDYAAVVRMIERLETFGVTLDHPHSSALKDSKYPFRELRIQSSGHPLRAVYIFDVTREAVVVCGGDKTGDKRFYKTIIAQAERIWEQYLREQGR